MKKRFILMMCFIMMFAFQVMSVSAATPETEIKLSEARVYEGDTVVMTISLPEELAVQSITITPIYDNTVLEYLTGSWLIDGSSKEVKTNGEAILERLDTTTTDFDNICGGDVLSYTFKVKENVGKYGVTRISCNVTVTNDDEIIGLNPLRPDKLNILCQHVYGEYEDGIGDYHQRTCEICKRSKVEVHTWSEGIVTKEPTCAENGEKTYTCTICNGTKTESIRKTVVHTYEDWEYDTDLKHKRTCIVCEKSTTARHAWDDGVVTQQSTCGEEGVKTYTCKICGGTKTESVRKSVGHTYGNWENDTDLKHKHTCTVCGVVTTAKHAWDDGVVTQQSTCAEEGVKTYTCKICGGTKTESVRKSVGHTYGDWEYDTDLKHKRTCIVCEKSTTARHAWDDGVVTQQSTCGEEGVKTYTCKICGGTKTESVRKSTAHTYGDWEYESDIKHQRTCTVCGETRNGKHKWDDGVCTICDEEKK